MSELFERATLAFRELNRDWIDEAFSTFDRLEPTVRVPGEDLGYRYTFYGAVLRTRMGKWVDFSDSGPLCGDNGGKTKKGNPCKKPAQQNGRCKIHPPEMFMVSLNAGDVVPEITLLFGENDSELRPRPTPLNWRACAAVLPDGQTLHFIDFEDAPVTFTSVDHVWNKIMYDIKVVLKLPSEATVTVDDKVYGVDHLWPVETLLSVCQLQGPIFTEEGTELRVGHLLKDYGVFSGATTRLISESRR
jgi:hypothetical protein